MRVRTHHCVAKHAKHKSRPSSSIQGVRQSARFEPKVEEIFITENNAKLFHVHLVLVEGDTVRSRELSSKSLIDAGDGYENNVRPYFVQSLQWRRIVVFNSPVGRQRPEHQYRRQLYAVHYFVFSPR